MKTFKYAKNPITPYKKSISQNKKKKIKKKKKK